MKTKNTASLLKHSVNHALVSARIRKLAAQGAPLRFTWEARQEMEDTGLEQVDILTVLKKCRVIALLGSSVAENFHYRVQANTADERGVILRVKIEESQDGMEQIAIIRVRWAKGGKP